MSFGVNAAKLFTINRFLPLWMNYCETVFRKPMNSTVCKHASSTLSLLVYAAFQAFHFERKPTYFFPLRYMVWAARCDSSCNAFARNSKLFIDICKSLPTELTKNFSDLFDASRLKLASDRCVNDHSFIQSLEIELPWETRGIEP